MKVGVPMAIADTVTMNYTVTNSPDSLLPEYDATKTDYSQNDEVRVVAEKKKYKLASATIPAGTTPKENPTIWFPSPLIEYAMFHYDNEYATEIQGNIEFTIAHANTIDTLFLQGVDGESVRVELIDGNGSVLDTLTEDIYEWEIVSLEKYLFPDDLVLIQKIEFDFIELELDTIKVTIFGTNTKCRYFVACYKEEIGMTLRNGIGYNQNNFFKSERDAWGNLVNGSLMVIEDVSLPVLDYNAQANTNANRVARLFAKPNLWIADDRDKLQREHEFINIFGILTSNHIVPGAAVTQKTLKIERK